MKFVICNFVIFLSWHKSFVLTFCIYDRMFRTVIFWTPPRESRFVTPLSSGTHLSPYCVRSKDRSRWWGLPFVFLQGWPFRPLLCLPHLRGHECTAEPTLLWTSVLRGFSRTFLHKKRRFFTYFLEMQNYLRNFASSNEGRGKTKTKTKRFATKTKR